MPPYISDVFKHFPLYQSKNAVQEVYSEDNFDKFHIIHCDLIGLYNKVSDLFIVTHFYEHLSGGVSANLFIIAKQKSWFGFKWVAFNIQNNELKDGGANINNKTFGQYLKTHFKTLATAIPFTKMPAITNLKKFTKRMKEYSYPAIECLDKDASKNEYCISLPENLDEHDKESLNSIKEIYNSFRFSSASVAFQSSAKLEALPLKISQLYEIKTQPFPYHYLPCVNGDYIYFYDCFERPYVIEAKDVIATFKQVKDDALSYQMASYWTLFVNDAVKQEYISKGNQLLKQDLLKRLLEIRRSIIDFKHKTAQDGILKRFEKLEVALTQRNENIWRLIDDKKDIEVI
jgi:hypothetical protein